MAAQRPPEPINQGAEPGCAGVNCGAIIHNEFSGNGTAGAAGSLAQREPWEAWPGHSRTVTRAKPWASPSPAGAVEGSWPCAFCAEPGGGKGCPASPARGWEPRGEGGTPGSMPASVNATAWHGEVWSIPGACPGSWMCLIVQEWKHPERAVRMGEPGRSGLRPCLGPCLGPYCDLF